MAEKSRMTWEEFAREHPEYTRKKKKTMQNKMSFLCQCKTGHVFDYRERERYSKDNPHYAPCQGKCPYCGDSFTFIGAEVMYIQLNGILQDNIKERLGK